MAATLECARAGVTTGEWAGALREVFGEYRAPTGVSGPWASAGRATRLAAVRERVRATGDELGERLRVLVAKPGLDGHSNGAEQVAVRARDAGFEVVYQGIRLTPRADRRRRGRRGRAPGRHLDPVRLAHGAGARDPRGLREAGAGEVPVVVGGIVPDSDARALRAQGVAAVFTPKDFGLTEIMGEMVDEIRRARGLGAGTPVPA